MAYFSSYFYQDHFLSPPTREIVIDEDFHDNQMHYGWDLPSWDRQTWTLWNGQLIYKNSQLKIENNTLEMTTEKNEVSGEPRIKSGEITSTNFLNHIFGLHECCMKPGGQWDSFWMWFSDNQAKGQMCYEIDICEMECDTNAAFTLTIHKWGVDGKTDSILGTARFQLKKDLTDNYHVWAADWQPGYIDFYLDGIKIYHYTGEIPNCPMYVWVSNSYKTVIPTTSLVKQIRVQV